MEQMQRLIQVVVPIALFSFLHALYRASGNQRTLTNELDSDIIETERVGNPPEGESPRRTEKVGDLPPWIRKIGRNYMFRYLRGVTTERGYEKAMSRRGRSPGEKRE